MSQWNPGEVPPGGAQAWSGGAGPPPPPGGGYVPPSPAGGGKPWWQSWPVVVAAIAVIAIAAWAVGRGSASNTESTTASAGNASETTETTGRPTTTTTTRPTTTTTTVPEDQLYREMQAEIERACTEAFSAGSSPEPEFDNRWAGLSDPSKLIAAAQTCIDTKNQQAIDGAQPVNVDVIVKDPDSVTGVTFVMVVEITQFDGATGACNFRGVWDNQPQEYSFDYAGDNAFFTSGDGSSYCPVLDGIDQNDVIRVWGKSLGSYSYDTQIGGNTTVPSFNVLRAEVIAKQ